MSGRQYYVKVYPNTAPNNDMHNGGFETRCREDCREIKRQILRHVDRIDPALVEVGWEDVGDDGEVG